MLTPALLNAILGRASTNWQRFLPPGGSILPSQGQTPFGGQPDPQGQGLPFAGPREQPQNSWLRYLLEISQAQPQPDQLLNLSRLLGGSKF